MFEGPLVAPDAPGDARELIGESDGRHVVAVSVFNTERPGAKTIGFIHELGGTQNGTSPVDEEHAQVAVASLGDATESSR